jgi:hypothetical protein
VNATLRYTQLGFAVAALLDKQEPLDADQARQYVDDGSLLNAMILVDQTAVPLALPSIMSDFGVGTAVAQ